MNTKCNTKRVGTWSLSTINYSLLTIHSAQRAGISLMEVLASVFVIGIGLLGVLAVIPYGVYQVSKANHADYASNVLKNAEAEIKIRELAVIQNWSMSSPYRTTDTNLVTPDPDYFQRTPTDRYDCSAYLLVDPFFEPGSRDIASVQMAANVPHVRVVGRGDATPGSGFDRLDDWQELMRDKDDLLYTLHEDRRTEFVGNRPISSGNYTWFFMFRPEPVSTASPITAPWWFEERDVEQRTVVDVLGCYNRVPGEARTVFARYISPSDLTDDFVPTLTGASITFRAPDRESLDISQTKYIFVSWVASWDSGPPIRMNYADGVWCRIVNAGPIEEETDLNKSIVALPEDNTNIDTVYRRTLFVLNSIMLPSTTHPVALRGLIVPGVLYHKRIEGVPIKP